MKDKIIEILRNTITSLHDDDFEDIAKEIERLFFDGLSDELKERLEDHLKQLRQDQ